MERPSLPQKLAAAAHSDEPIWTPECLEPDDLIILIEQGAKTPDTVARMAHIVSCAYCRHEFDAMERTLQIATRVQELQKPASVSVTSPPFAVVAEKQTEARPSRPSFWQRLLSPSAGFALGAAAAALLLFLLRVLPLETQNTKLLSQSEEWQRSAVAALAETERATQAEEETARLHKQNRELQQKIALNQSRITALESQAAQSLQTVVDGEKRTQEVLREVAQATEQASLVLHQGSRQMGGSDSASASIHPLSPVASVLLNNRVRFRWEPETDATHYQVIVLDSESRQIAKSPPTTKTEWKASLPPAPDKTDLSYYEWVVVAQQNGKEIRRSIPIKFAVLDTARLLEKGKAK